MIETKLQNTNNEEFSGQERRKPIFGIIDEHFVCIGNEINEQLADYFLNLKLKHQRRRPAIQVNVEERTTTKGGEHLLQFLLARSQQQQQQQQANDTKGKLSEPRSASYETIHSEIAQKLCFLNSTRTP